MSTINWNQGLRIRPGHPRIYVRRDYRIVSTTGTVGTALRVGNARRRYSIRLTPIMSKVAGYVRDFPNQDFERVRKGQVLTQLVDDDYRAAVAEATANIARQRLKQYA